MALKQDSAVWLAFQNSRAHFLQQHHQILSWWNSLSGTTCLQQHEHLLCWAGTVVQSPSHSLDLCGFALLFGPLLGWLSVPSILQPAESGCSSQKELGCVFKAQVWAEGKLFMTEPHKIPREWATWWEHLVFPFADFSHKIISCFSRHGKHEHSAYTINAWGWIGSFVLSFICPHQRSNTGLSNIKDFIARQNKQQRKWGSCTSFNCWRRRWMNWGK